MSRTLTVTVKSSDAGVESSVLAEMIRSVTATAQFAIKNGIGIEIAVESEQEKF